MSEKSFAVGSIAAAIVCGVFFYPPPPPERAAPANQAAVPAQRKVVTAKVDQAGNVERGWLRKRMTQLKPSASLHP
jgi:hypothetical protein